MNPVKAVAAIKKLGACLVYPLNNSREIANLWHAYFPRSRMSWDWDENSDNRVAYLWHLRATLSQRKDIAYTKLYQNRATFCSLPVFEAFHAMMNLDDPKCARLSPYARKALELLLDNSPQSSKALRKELDLGGKLFESTWQKAMRELWHRGLIVGCGEVDDGAFPSLAIGASELIHETSIRRARAIKNVDEAWLILAQKLGVDSPFYKYFQKLSVTVGREPKLARSSRRL